MYVERQQTYALLANSESTCGVSTNTDRSFALRSDRACRGTGRNRNADAVVSYTLQIGNSSLNTVRSIKRLSITMTLCERGYGVERNFIPSLLRIFQFCVCYFLVKNRSRKPQWCSGNHASFTVPST
jgi:hypothetical protein